MGGANGWNYLSGATVNPDPNYIWDTEAGGIEQNGTFNMMGNVQEWMESAADGVLDDLYERRTYRGGGYASSPPFLASTGRLNEGPTEFTSLIGFRIAAIPEPSSALLMMVGAGGLIFYRRARRREMEHHVSRKDFG